MTENLDAETFSLDDWLKDAHLPERSCRIFRGGHLIAEMERIREELEDEQAAVSQSLQSSQRIAELTESYYALLEQFGASALTVFMRALPRETMRALRDDFEKLATAHKWTKARSDIEYGYYLVANSIVGVQEPGSTRKPVSWDPQAVRKLEKTIGPGELRKMLDTYKLAQDQVKEPDADFLQKSSGGNKDDTES